MSQAQSCECVKPSIEIPVRGLKLSLDEEALSSFGKSCDCVSYSFEEQWTGKFWVNGKRIYQKTIGCGALPGNEAKLIPHGIGNIDCIAQFYGTASNSSNVLHIPHVNPISTLFVSISINQDEIGLRTWHNELSNYTKTFITILYTCTDH